MPLALFEWLSNTEVIIIGIIGIMLFGKDLPEMMRKFGKKVTDIKRNVDALQGDLKSAAGSFQNEVGGSMRSVTDSMRSLDNTIKQASDSMQESVDGTTPKKKRSSFANDSDRDEPVTKKFAPPEEDALDVVADAAEAANGNAANGGDSEPRSGGEHGGNREIENLANLGDSAKWTDSKTTGSNASAGSTDS